MKLGAPGLIAFVMSLALVVLAVFGGLTWVPYISRHSVWIAVCAYLILATSSLLNEQSQD